MPASSPAKGALDAHICTLYRSYRDVSACRCGAFWMPVSGELLSMALVSSGLRERLRRYRLAIEFGDYQSLADWVRHEADEARAVREAERERGRLRWPAQQRAKRAKWLRHVRDIILSGPCAYCGGEAAELDHVTPVSQGGADVMRNFAAACGRCNGEKSNRTPEQWKAWRLARGRAWPPPPSRPRAPRPASLTMGPH